MEAEKNKYSYSKKDTIVINKECQSEQQIFNVLISQDYGDTKSADDILTQLKNHSDINKCTKVHWKWADSLSIEQLDILIKQVIPSSTLSFGLDGCVNISDFHLENLFEKCRKLEKFNAYYQNDQNWDLLSMKNYRQRSKWCSKITLNKNNLGKSLNFPPNLTVLCLKNVKLSQVINPIDIILKGCQYLKQLDISNTLITDENLQQLSQKQATHFASMVTSLKMNRNRLSITGLYKILAFDQKKTSSNLAALNTLRVIEINQTNVTQFYPAFCQYFPNLQKLGIEYLHISQIQLKMMSQKGYIRKQLKQLNLGSHQISIQSLGYILKSSPNIQSLNLSNLQITDFTQKDLNGFQFPVFLKNVDLSCAKFCQADNLVSLLLDSCKNLEILKLSGTNISGKILMKIGEVNQSKIQWLEISYLQQLDLGQQQIISQFEIKEQSLQTSWDKILSMIMKKLFLNLRNLQYFEGYGMFLNRKNNNMENILEQLKQECRQGENHRIIQIMVDLHGLIEVKVNQQKQ